MKRLSILSILIALLVLASSSVYADENSTVSNETNVVESETVMSDKANQIIEMEDNKINVIVMKQPMNEQSNQKITLKRNWLGVYIQINGKIKVNPLTSNYEVE